jgi:hypothetical protein
MAPVSTLTTSLRSHAIAPVPITMVSCVKIFDHAQSSLVSIAVFALILLISPHSLVTVQIRIPVSFVKLKNLANLNYLVKTVVLAPTLQTFLITLVLVLQHIPAIIAKLKSRVQSTDTLATTEHVRTASI